MTEEEQLELRHTLDQLRTELQYHKELVRLLKKRRCPVCGHRLSEESET